MTKKALLVIDLQNDYFPHGKYPLWNTEQTLNQVKTAIARAKAQNIEVIHVQHIADPEKGIAPFFNQGTQGSDIHAEILAAAPEAAVVTKRFADSFEQTNLDELLQKQGISELLLCGMMTQNCVTHTAISKAAEKYKVAIVADCCTTVDEMIHNIALNAVALRVPLVTMEQVLLSGN
ncbi:cysteine hydrolase [Vibrio navarrensis]|uniref:Cysteine hydrolase n=1 Tax=Vibrio navarrensis TaxID=29495 RepID=A0A099MM91_9VIBR|nr:cysteine hydrolase family protein [Vibrio navarrensis]EGR2797523.1 cysteine hydrolase [Vibrio navarrensis]EHA1123537.1 cysteine hydrolase [Vibrio navarrensis]EJK2114111.1 cysteine hydrolase [Vibrio navarrensis]EJL6393695.1 cysteine hydrolase [Vibrio navarrensis]EKA5634561.1 cysteine hydrolase [Vibrio navarrensis]